MLKQTVTYTDFNDQEQTEDLYFHLSKSDLVDMLEKQPEFEEWAEKASNIGDRELTDAEVMEFLKIIRDLIDRSYGERSDDGKRFVKNDQVLQDFKSSAVYDEFLFGLFTKNAEPAIEFLNGIMPKGLDRFEAAASSKNTQQVDLPGPTIDHTEKVVPAYIRENRNPTKAELSKMNPDELQEAFRRKMANTEN